MDKQRWIHEEDETMRVGIVDKKAITRFDTIPLEVREGLRALANPIDSSEVPDGAFVKVEKWSRTDGVDTYVAVNGKDVLFCDAKGDEWIGRAAISGTSVATFRIFNTYTHHYFGEHLLWTMNQYCLAHMGEPLDSGGLTNIKFEHGYKRPSAYEAAHGIWDRAVGEGWAEIVRRSGQETTLYSFKKP